MAFLDNAGLERLWEKITAKFTALVGDQPVTTQISNIAAPKAHASSATTYGVSTNNNYGHAKASSTTPKANGIAAVGSETSSFARGDHVHPLQTSVSGNAGTATKLATARTISLAGSHTGSASFDGSGNITINTWASYVTSSVGNTNNYPYHRFAKLDTITTAYQDRSAAYIVSGDYSGGGWGIFRLTLRTNNNSVSTVNVDWIVRQGINADFIQVGLYNVYGSTYADAFIKTPGTYAGYVVHLLESGSRGAVSSTWTLVNSKEVNDTTSSDAKTSSEAYASIAAAGTALHNKAYSTIVAGADQGTVKTAASATKATQDASGNTITSTYATKTELSALDSELDRLTGGIPVTEQISNNAAPKSHTHSVATTSAAGFMSKEDKSKLDGITASADSVNFSRSLTSGTKVGTITINGTGTDLYAPTNTDTHYTTGLKVGASNTATANAAASNGNVYLNVLDNTTVRDSHKIVGSGATTVTSDANGVITVNSTNTTYSIATTSANGLMSKEDKSKLDGIETGANKTVVDSALSTTSTNPVQNKVVKDAFDSLVGDKPVATQIENAMGAIAADSIGAMSIELLWENTVTNNQLAVMNAGNISVDWSPYQYILIECAVHSTTAQRLCGYILPCAPTSTAIGRVCFMNFASGDTDKTVSRQLILRDGFIEVQNCKLCSAGSLITDTSITNKYCVPRFIYGIKG